MGSAASSFSTARHDISHETTTIEHPEVLKVQLGSARLPMASQLADTAQVDDDDGPPQLIDASGTIFSSNAWGFLGHARHLGSMHVLRVMQLVADLHNCMADADQHGSWWWTVSVDCMIP